MKTIKSTSIILQSGMLLSKEILNQMITQNNLFKLQYDNYPDGIIYGFEYIESEDNKTPFFSSGLIKYKGKYYFSTEKINIFDILDEFDNNEELKDTIYSAIVLKPSANKEINYEGIESDCLEISLCNVNEIDKNNNIILLEFQYYKGKRFTMLREEPETALSYQMNSKEYYYSFLNVKYSIPNELTFSPYIFKLMKKCLSQKQNKSISDLMLLYMLSQNKIISKKVLMEWFKSYKSEIDEINFSNSNEIIQSFLKTLKIEYKEKEKTEKTSDTSKNQEKDKPRRTFGTRNEA